MMSRYECRRWLLVSILLAAWGTVATTAAAQDGSYDWTEARELYAGIRYARVEAVRPRTLVVHSTRIDSQTPGVKFHTTARRPEWVDGHRETDRQTTRNFLRSSRAAGVPMVFAVNADAFAPWPAPYQAETASDLRGLAVSGGTLVSRGSGTPSLVVAKTGELRIAVTQRDTDISNIETAVSGFGLCLVDGQISAGGNDLHPRTGIGLCPQKRYVVVVAIDGRQPDSVGATTSELGAWLKHFGAAEGINMDGGGSTTIVWWDPTAPASDGCRLLNRPVGDGRDLGAIPSAQFTPTERANGNNLGVSLAATVAEKDPAKSSAASPTDVPLIGYTELRTNLPGGRHANVRTMRAMVVKADGSGRRPLAEQLVNEPDAWTQFAGWSPDGTTAIIVRGWQNPENAKWEEEHKTFRHSKDGWLVDTFLVDLGTGQLTNVTAVERVSHYNSGLFYWPNDPTMLGFTALIDGNSHPFRMDRDGRHKVDLTKDSQEFAYGFSSSPDGKRIAYHKSYQVFLADADGANALQVPTGHPFNFAPTWAPNGEWLLFVSGEHYCCHPHVVRADGSGLKKVADRGGYRGVTEFLDVFDFHGGSSDLPVWSSDGKSIFYTALTDDCVELYAATLDGRSERLTRSSPGTLHYHPQPSADGQWLLFGAKRAGVRQLFVRGLRSHDEHRVTDLTPGFGAMWPHWQPSSRDKSTR